ncbi:hypothetical protein ACSMXM_05465 [Pacificimonas sp. ICDLI1SI03]
MNATYDRARETAQRLISEYGGDATLVRITRAFDEVEQETTTTETPVAIKAILQPPVGNVEMALINAGTIEKRFRAIVSSAVEPKDGDRLLIGAYEFPVVGVTPVAPDGEAIVYQMQLGDA